MPIISGLLDTRLSLNAIATQLNASSMPKQRGGRWTAKAVSRVMQA